MFPKFVIILHLKRSRQSGKPFLCDLHERAPVQRKDILRRKDFLGMYSLGSILKYWSEIAVLSGEYIAKCCVDENTLEEEKA